MNKIFRRCESFDQTFFKFARPPLRHLLKKVDENFYCAKFAFITFF